MHQAPPLRVSRPVSACSRCRSAKIKCDGKLPACSACERAGKAAECSSGNDEFARGKERSYVAALETKIERLERQVQSRSSLSHSVTSQDSMNVSAATSANLTASKVAEAGDVNELVSDFGYLAVHATSNGYHGFDKEMSLARLMLSIATRIGLPAHKEYPLPTRLDALELMQACITEFFPLWPVMSYAAAAGALERVYHRSQRLASSLDKWNTRLMIALGYCIRSQANGDASYKSALQHVSVAVLQFGEDIISPGSLERLQSLILLVLFSTVDQIHFESWYLVGMATRFTVEMGLHINDNQYSINGITFEEGRRLFHVVYALDRSISISYQRPFSFSDDSVDLRLPSKYTPNDIRVNQAFLIDKREDFAKDFNLLLQHQSGLYYELFYSEPPRSTIGWEERRQKLSRHRLQVSKLPSSIPISLQGRFLAQAMYVSILLLLPYPDSSIPAKLVDRSLILENIDGYSSALTAITTPPESLSQSRVQDLRCTINVGQRLILVGRGLANMCEDHEVYNADRELREEVLSSFQKEKEVLIRNTVDLLYKIDNVLTVLSCRFGETSSYCTWKTSCAETLKCLKVNL